MNLEAYRTRLAASSSSPVELSIILLFVLVTGLWASLIRDLAQPLINVYSPIYFTNIGELVMYVFGVGSAVVVYLRARGLSVDLGRPTLSPFGLACVGIPAAAVFLAVPLGLLIEVDVLRLFRRVNSYTPVIPTWRYVLNVALSSAFFAVAYGLLVCGVVYETVRGFVTTTRRETVVLSIALASVIHIFPVSVEFVNTHMRYSLIETERSFLTLSVLGFTVAVCIAACLGILYRTYARSDVSYAISLWYTPVYAMAVVGVSFFVIDLPSYSEELWYALVSACAVVGYDRTRSIWVAITTFGLFEFTIGIASIVF